MIVEDQEHLLDQAWVGFGHEGEMVVTWVRGDSSRTNAAIPGTSEVHYLVMPQGLAFPRPPVRRVSLAGAVDERPHVWTVASGVRISYLDPEGVCLRRIDDDTGPSGVTDFPVSFTLGIFTEQVLVAGDLWTLAFAPGGHLRRVIIPLGAGDAASAIERTVRGAIPSRSRVHCAFPIDGSSIGIVYSSKGERFGQDILSLCQVRTTDREAPEALPLPAWERIRKLPEQGLVQGTQALVFEQKLSLLLLTRRTDNLEKLSFTSISLQGGAVETRLLATGPTASVACPSMDVDGSGGIHATWLQKAGVSDWSVYYCYIGARCAAASPRLLSNEAFERREAMFEKRPTVCRGSEFVTVWTGAIGGVERIWMCRGRVSGGR